jgi:glycosyltransferase involved in cell wall biosynthesis
MIKKTVSIIIPTKDRSSDLKDVLTSLQLALVPDFSYEILVIDNASTDDTKQTVLDFLKKLPIRYIFEPKLGLHNARNRGLKESDGDILAYIDDDILISKNWLCSIPLSFSLPDVVMATGNCFPLFDDSAPDWLVKFWNRRSLIREQANYFFWPLSIIRFSHQECTRISPSLVWGCNFLIKKQFLLDAKGFHPDALPSNLKFYRGDGESYLGRIAESMGLSALYNSELSIFHKVHKSRLTESYFAQRGYNEGITRSYCNLRYGGGQKGSILQLLHTVVSAISIRRFPSKTREMLALIEENAKLGFKDHQAWFKADEANQKWVKADDYLN